MKSIFKYTTILATAVVFFFACEKDDYTGDSRLNPSNPTIAISGVDAAGYNFVEKDTVITFDVTLSVPQISDVQLTVKQIAGDATVLEDYSIVNSGSEVVIPAYATSGKLSIKILTDDLAEGVETFTLQIGDQATANANLTPVIAVFTIGNYTEPTLDVEMSWTTDVATSIGLDLDPDEVIDLRMLVIDNATGEIVAVEDGASFETYAAWDTLPDGDYTIAADVFASIYAGDFDDAITANIDLLFNQAGVINDQVLSFSQVITDEFECDAYRTNLAVVTKTGDDYTIEKEVSYLVPETQKWSGTDEGYNSQVRTLAGCDLLIGGLNHGWMYDFWGEEVVDSVDVIYTVDEDGNIEIPLQDYFTTLYNGSEYLYQIEGTGTLDVTGEFPVMQIEYYLYQDGFDVSGWAYDNGYMTTPYFVADITLDPASMTPEVAKTLMKFPLVKKPIR